MAIFDYDEFLSQALPSEAEIMASWRNVEGGPVVSIICTTFNHVEYIRSALHGFLLQKTCFPFEVVVHDDASSDGTVDLIRDYHNRFPNIIIPVFQSQNQYSQGRKVFMIAAGHSCGRYLALCEGDDFWIDENKLERQFCELENHADADLCFHDVVRISSDPLVMSVVDNPKVALVAFSEVVRGGGGYIATPSIMVRRSVIDSMPNWFQKAPVGDYFIQMLGARRGGAIRLSQKMAAYRVMTAGSWSVRLRSTSAERVEQIARRLDQGLEQLQEDSGGAYMDDFRYARARAYCLYASEALSAGHFRLGRRLIEESWAMYRWARLKQVFMYKLRRALVVVAWLRQKRAVLRHLLN